MPPSKKNNLQFKRAFEQVQAVKVQIVEDLAKEVAKEAQRDAPVDTGFYKDHIFAIAPGEKGRRAYSQWLINRHGRRVRRRSITIGPNRSDTAQVVASAVYSIHVERKYHVLQNAVFKVSLSKVIAKNKI